MATRLSYDIKNENGKWGNIIDISSEYTHELNQEIGLKYGERVLVTTKEIERHLGGVRSLIQENEKFLNKIQNELAQYKEMYTKCETEITIEKTTEEINSYLSTIDYIQEQNKNYEKIALALVILSESYDLTISYFMG